MNNTIDFNALQFRHSTGVDAGTAAYAVLPDAR